MDHADAPPAPSRRDLLAALATVTTAPFALPACREAPFDGPVTVIAGDLPQPGVDPVRVDLSAVPPDGRLLVTWGAVPVEVRRAGGALEAIALLCTHQGCKVTWQAAAAQYVCACHEGRFDQAGRPVAGLPTTPLRRVPLVVTPHSVYVGATAGA